MVYPVTDMAFTGRVENFSPMTPRDDVADFRFIPVLEIDTGMFGMDSVQKVLEKFKKTYA